MSYDPPVTAVPDVAYPSVDFNKIVDDIIYLHAQRPLSGYVYDGTDWSPTAADATWEDDTSATAKVTVVPVATSTIRVTFTARVTSNTVRAEAIGFRVKLGASYGDDLGYAGWGIANTRIQYSATYDFPAQPAGSVDVILSARQAAAGDAITIEDRQIEVEVIPE